MKKLDKPEGTRGAVYLRCSSDLQESQSQREEVQRWLDKHGLTARWYTDDEGRNSRHKSEKREQFQRLMDDVRLGMVDWIVVDAQDRMGFKHAFEFGSFVNLLLDHRCHLWSVHQGHLSNIDDASCQIMGSVGGVTSRSEQNTKSERVIRGKISKFHKGTYPGGNVSFGLDVAIIGPDGKEKWRVEYLSKNERKKVYPDGRTERYDGPRNFPRYDAEDTPYYAWTKDKVKIKTIKFIFSWYDREAIATSAIARWLNKQNILTQTGRLWQGIDVRTLLRNPIYKGIIAGGKEASGDFYRITKGESVPVQWDGNIVPKRELFCPSRIWKKPPFGLA
jgi:DNA invertase Pin-like site-specific DNA recombinase